MWINLAVGDKLYISLVTKDGIELEGHYSIEFVPDPAFPTHTAHFKVFDRWQFVMENPREVFTERFGPTPEQIAQRILTKGSE